jgi:caffeoyl-CoA O-methyltransferase
MNRLLFRSASASAIYKLGPCVQVWKRFHSTDILKNTVSNDKGRLRSGEEHYCTSLSTPFKQPYLNVLQTLAKETEQKFSNPHMMVGNNQAKLLSQLVAILRPTRVLEIGGFTGFSAIAMGSALANNAKLISLELDPEHIKTARKYVKQANLQDKVDFKEGPASDR